MQGAAGRTWRPNSAVAEDQRQDLDDPGEIQVLRPRLERRTIGLTRRPAPGRPDAKHAASRTNDAQAPSVISACSRTSALRSVPAAAATVTMAAARSAPSVPPPPAPMNRSSASSSPSSAPGSVARRSARPGRPAAQRRGGGGVLLAHVVDTLEPRLDRGPGHRAEHDRLAARSNGLGKLLRMRRGEHEVRPRRRLLEGLQHVVSRLLGEPVGARDHRDAPASRVGREREELLQRRACLLVAGLALRRGSHAIDAHVLRGRVLEPEVGVRFEAARPARRVEQLGGERRARRWSCRHPRGRSGAARA